LDTFGPVLFGTFGPKRTGPNVPMSKSKERKNKK